MKYYEQADQLFSQNPWPDDMPEQMDKIIAKAKGVEKQMLICKLEVMYQGASEEQLAKWNELTDEELKQIENGEWD